MSSGSEKLEDCLGHGSGHVHLVGICGIGMAGLALLLKKAGFKVSGCDSLLNDLADRLRTFGIEVFQGHGASHVNANVDFVVRTSAVPLDAPELIAAFEAGVPVFRRGEVLASITSHWSNLCAVSGTHGKTSTSSFLLQIFKHLGKDPSWCIGGDTPEVGQLGVAGIGDGPDVIVESDESDGTVALYSPSVGVVTNIEYDHMENFSDPDAFVDCFRAFVERVKGTIVFCADDPGSKWLNDHKNAVSFGVSENSDYRVCVKEEAGSFSSFDIVTQNGVLCHVKIPIPGRHNILNAAAALTAAVQSGLEAEAAAEALGSARLPGRRFERVAEHAGISVVSDYAHHPSEIRALVQTARTQGSERILAVFQPHRYSRTSALCADFPPAFEGVDELLLCPVYAASEDPIAGGTIYDLYKCFRELAVDGVPVPVLAQNLDQAWAYLKSQLRSGDQLLVVGAGDVEQVAQWAKKEIESLPLVTMAQEEISLSSKSSLKLKEPLVGKTTLGVGGYADVWIDVGTEEDLSLALAWSFERDLPFRCIGCGSNILVSDLGLRGVTARLSGESFSLLEEVGADEESPDMTVVRVGAGVKISQLLTWTSGRGLSGLEFLESIPATLGGILRMNAGAWGDEIKNCVSLIRCLNSDGSTCILRREELEWDYRRCVSLKNRFIIEATLVLARASSESVDVNRKEVRDRRAWMKGIRSAGSVFLNPPDDTAGRLIDVSGCKGLSVGGARVFEQHANVIVMESGATASDAKALLEIVRADVGRKQGVHLDSELVEMI